MRWLVFGSYDVRRHPRVGVLVEGLQGAGDEVIELNEPLTLDTAARIAVLRQPWRLPLLLGKLARCWTLLVVRALRQRRGSTAGPVDAVLVGYLGHFDVHLARLLFRGTPIVLDHLVSAAGTARDRGLAGAGGARERLMRAIDDAALRRADVVLVDTAEHLAALPAPARDRGIVVPVGAGAQWFAAGARTVRQRWPGGPAGGGRWRLRVVFVGLFTPLHGTRTLGAALAALAADDSIEVTVVGTGQDHPACRRAAADNPRVTWHDWIPAGELPALVAGHHVSLGIFGETAKAGRVVPTKVFQGAAAGCAIVTSDTAPQRRALGDAAVFVPAGDPAALASALRELAGDPDRLARFRRAARRRAVEHFWPATVVTPVRHRIDPTVRRDAAIPTPSPDASGGPTSDGSGAPTPAGGNLTTGPAWWVG
ncbi:glycosyltransferase [Plantactinospora mayteni]|uniref:glycosyltransferase n=1 Tax=Plantactinospora mayteni TaxID=566021 RepID=UPI001942F364|nr:glycosyltransferase [Plantactinospora mayteni]